MPLANSYEREGGRKRTVPSPASFFFNERQQEEIKKERVCYVRKIHESISGLLFVYTVQKKESFFDSLDTHTATAYSTVIHGSNQAREGQISSVPVTNLYRRMQGVRFS